MKYLPHLIILLVLLGVGYILSGAGLPEPAGDGTPEGNPTATEGGGPGAVEAAPQDGGGRTVVGDPEAAPDGAAVRGRVTGPDGRPVPGARVRLVESGGFLAMGLDRPTLAEGMEACRADGGFVLAVPDAMQTVSVAALAPGYAPARTEVEDLGAPVALQLVPVVEVPGRVVDGSGAPVADARLFLTSADLMLDGLPAPFDTGADGAFRLEAPGAGSYALLVRSAAGADVELDPLEVRAGMEPVEVRVQGSGGLVVRLTDPAGAPVEGALVTTEPAGAHRDRFGGKRARSGADGVARVRDLKVGTHLLEVTAPGFAKVLRRHLQRDAAQVDLAITLAPPGGIEVRVTDRDGVAAADFEVQLHSDQPSLRIQVGPTSRVTDAEGVARWEDLPSGTFRVIGGGQGWQIELESAVGDGSSEGAVKRREGFGSSVASVGVLPGQTSPVELRLMGHARVSAEVLAGGIPLAGAEVLLHQRAVSAGHFDARGVTGPAGTVELPPVRPGRFLATVRFGDGRSEFTLPDQIEVDEPRERLVIDLPLSSVAGRLRGTAGPLAGARVELNGAGAPTSWTGSGPDGAFLLEHVPQGEFLVRVSLDGYLPWTSEAPLAFDGSSPLDLGVVTLMREAVVKGRAVGLPPEQNTGFSLRVAELRDATGKRVAVAPLERGDRFEFRGVMPGSYQVVVTAAGAVGQPVSVELVEGVNQVELGG